MMTPEIFSTGPAGFVGVGSGEGTGDGVGEGDGVAVAAGCVTVAVGVPAGRVGSGVVAGWVGV